MTEAELQRRVQDLLEQYGLRWFRIPDSRRVMPGWPDLTIIGRRLICRELKTMWGDLTKEQSQMRYLLRAAGVDWEIWRPADLESGRIDLELSEIAR
jgi:hypothetical protein